MCRKQSITEPQIWPDRDFVGIIVWRETPNEIIQCIKWWQETTLKNQDTNINNCSYFVVSNNEFERSLNKFADKYHCHLLEEDEFEFEKNEVRIKTQKSYSCHWCWIEYLQYENRLPERKYDTNNDLSEYWEKLWEE